MSQRSKVVPKAEPLSETRFMATWLVTLARMCREHGDGDVALALGISTRHLRNVKAGTSLPSADKIWNLLAIDASAHDEIDREYGLKKVRADALCSSDPLTRDLIGLAHETAEHEAGNSDGGTLTTDRELRQKDEQRLRKVYRALGTWLNRIDDMRRPVLREVRA